MFSHLGHFSCLNDVLSSLEAHSDPAHVQGGQNSHSRVIGLAPLLPWGNKRGRAWPGPSPRLLTVPAALKREGSPDSQQKKTMAGKAEGWAERGRRGRKEGWAQGSNGCCVIFALPCLGPLPHGAQRRFHAQCSCHSEQVLGDCSAEISSVQSMGLVGQALSLTHSGDWILFPREFTPQICFHQGPQSATRLQHKNN